MTERFVAPRVSFSPVDNELPLRWLRRWRLVPANGLGTVHRAIFLVALIWLPIVIWSAVAGRLVDPSTGESLLRHYGIVVRCLVAVPLFVLAEAALHRTMLRIASHFESSGTIPPEQWPVFESAIAGVRRLRDSPLPWVFVLGITVAWLALDRPSEHDDALSWAWTSEGTLGFGGWWFAYVARPIFIALLLGWLWRIALVAHMFWCISRLELSLVPSHPDRAGGIGFVERLPQSYSLAAFAISSAIASRWAHEVSVHGTKLETYMWPAVAFAVVWTLFALSPLLLLAPALLRVRMNAVPAYGRLVGEQGRQVHQRWILGETIPDSPILDAPEIGPLADAATMYDAVRSMRPFPIGKQALTKVLIPIVIPMFILASLQIPIGELIMKVMKAVM